MVIFHSYVSHYQRVSLLRLCTLEPLHLRLRSVSRRWPRGVSSLASSLGKRQGDVVRNNEASRCTRYCISMVYNHGVFSYNHGETMITLRKNNIYAYLRRIVVFVYRTTNGFSMFSSFSVSSHSNHQCVYFPGTSRKW